MTTNHKERTVKTLLLIASLLALGVVVYTCGGCGGGGPDAAKAVGPYPGDPTPGLPGPVPPLDVTTPADPGLVVAAQYATPNDRFGLRNATGVPLDRVGFSREGEFIPGLGNLADHGDYLGYPWEWIEAGATWETPAYAHRPYDTPHVGIAYDILGQRYEALYVPAPGARGWVVTAAMRR